jgi:membrane protease YdiL (CAAX protease family)
MAVVELAAVLLIASLGCALLLRWDRQRISALLSPTQRTASPAWNRLSLRFALVAFLASAAVFFSRAIAHDQYLSALSGAPLWAALFLLFSEELFFRATVRESLVGLAGQALAYALIVAWPFSPGFGAYLSNALFLLFSGALCGFLYRRFGFVATLSFRVATLAAFLLGMVSGSIIIDLLLLLAPFVWLAVEGESPRRAAEYLGLKPMPAVRLISDCAWLLIVGMLLTALVGVVFAHLGFYDEGKVAEVIRSQGAVALLLGVTLGPFAEELFFRGLLSRRYGILASSVAFGLAHYFYGSVTEVAAAVAIGVLFAWYVRKTGNLVAPVFAHCAYNGLSMLVILSFPA